jgi:Tol biopolymer transport system component
MRHSVRIAPGLAAVVLTLGLSPILAQQESQDAVTLRKAITTELVDGDRRTAAEMYRKLTASSDRAVAVEAQRRMAEALSWLGRTGAQQGNTRGQRAVWTGEGVDLFGRVAPDGSFLSFTFWSRAASLAIHEFATNRNRLVVEGGAPDGGETQYSAISPDGRQIAYASWFEASREIRIASVEPGGAPPRTLIRFDPAQVRFHGVRDWSPDGRWLAIGTQRYDGASEIIIASVGDGSWRVLKTDAWRGADVLSFSRDSRYLAFDLPANDVETQRDVFVIDVAGNGRSPAAGLRAIGDTSDDWVVGWSPDGRHLLFSSDRTGPRGLWALPFAEGRPVGRPTLLRPDVGGFLSLGVSNAGSVYGYKRVGDRDVKVVPIDLEAGRLTGPVTHFRQGMLPRPQTPQWSPDGRSLVYQIRGLESGLAIRSVETGAARQLPQRLLYAQDPRWSRDGRYLVAGGRDVKGRDGIYRMEIETGEVTPIVHLSGLGSSPRWSADDRRIYYRVGPEIRERDLGTNVDRVVAKIPGLQGHEVSPDGRHLAVRASVDQATKSQGVFTVSLPGGAVREVARLPAGVTGGAVSWTPDSRSVLMSRSTAIGRELWLVEMETGRSRKLDVDIREWVGGFSLSPDGRSVAFLTGSDVAEIWAIENAIPPGN